MENKGTILKIIGGVAIIAAVFALGYAWMSGGGVAVVPVDAVSVDKTGNGNVDFLSSLVNLKYIELDTSIFKDRTFASLFDLGVAIDPQPKGRDNPFAPISGFVISGEGLTEESESGPQRSGPPKPTKGTGLSPSTPIPPNVQ